MNNEINQKKELHVKLWKMANYLRGNMDLYEFKDYILGLIFFRYICEFEEKEFNENLLFSVEDAFKDEPSKCQESCIKHKLNFSSKSFNQ